MAYLVTHSIYCACNFLLSFEAFEKISRSPSRWRAQFLVADVTTISGTIVTSTSNEPPIWPQNRNAPCRSPKSYSRKFSRTSTLHLFFPYDWYVLLLLSTPLSQPLSCKTCRTLYTATVSQRVWLHFARELYSGPQSPQQEEPLQDYTLDELRDWVLRRYQAEQVLNAPSGQDIRMRTVNCPLFRPRVLPGGRWFLSCTQLGEIIAVDMDSPEMVPKVLIRVEQCIEGTDILDPPDWFTVWVDPHESRLTFKIALIHALYLRQNSCTFRRFSFSPFHRIVSVLRSQWKNPCPHIPCSFIWTWEGCHARC